jgi:hypothetical protein
MSFTWMLLSQGPAVQRHYVSVTPEDEKAIAQAIEDEIYDEGCQGYGGDAAIKHDGLIYEQRVYIQPQLRNGPEEGEVGKGLGWVIYKLLPVGEIYRMVWFRNDGLAMLGGHPEWDFPPTEPSYLAVYMEDDDLMQLKRTWLRTTFVISLIPTKDQLRQAAARQKIRMEGDYRPHKRNCDFRWRGR